MALRIFYAIPLAASLLVPFASVEAAEQGMVIRPGDLMAQPFIDAAKTAQVATNEAVTIIERRGGWVNVEANGRTGWVRMLNVRLRPGLATSGGGHSGGGPQSSLASLLHTGSSGRTVTTGIKGMDEEDIRNATVNYAELEKLDTLGVEAADARANAQMYKLKESTVEYLKKGKSK